MVSTAVQRAAPTGLLEKLLAQVRAEFRVDIYVADRASGPTTPCGPPPRGSLTLVLLPLTFIRV